MTVQPFSAPFSLIFVPAQKPHDGHIAPLTSLRFFAAIWVVSLHYMQDAPFDVHQATYFFYNGRAAVDLFFILSGFILAHCYLTSLGEGRFAYGSYLWKRLARIYPLHLATLAPFFVLMLAIEAGFLRSDHPGAYEWDAVLPHLLLLQAWGTTDTPTFNYPSWSVSAEWFAYLLFPFLGWLALRLRPLAGIALALAFLLAAALVADHALPRKLTEITYDFGILRIVPSFLLGIAGYRLSRDYDVAQRMAWPLLAAVLVLLTLVLHGLPTPLVAIPLMGLLIFTLASLHRQGMSERMDRPTLIYLGEISYAIYMTHAMIDVFYFNAFDMIWPERGLLGGSLVWLAGVALTLPLAALAYHLVERPARRWLTRGSRRGTHVRKRVLEAT